MMRINLTAIAEMGFVGGGGWVSGIKVIIKYLPYHGNKKLISKKLLFSLLASFLHFSPLSKAES